MSNGISHLPNDLNKAILIINGFIFASILSYTYVVGAESILSEPFIFIYTSLTGIMVCLGVWYYKNNIWSDFYRQFGHFPDPEWHFYHSSYDYPYYLNLADKISVIAFCVYHLMALIFQTISK